MNRPYIVCHMMTSVDGRIDCAMTSKIEGVDAYYTTLNELDVPTTVSGRVTAMLELALPGKFECKDSTPYGKEGFSKKTEADGYEIIVDTKGTLLWDDGQESGKPYLIITSEQVSKEYLAYLDAKSISWIACGKERIDLKKACGILADEFGVKRMAIVGGGHINGSFLAAGLTDEVSILIGLGIDGREGMAAVFDGLPMNSEPIPLNLKDVVKFDDGAVWLRPLMAESFRKMAKSLYLVSFL